MDNLLLLAGVILICCALFQKIFRRTGVPGLFLFIALGMLFGSDGLLHIPFDNYDFAGSLCAAALVLIIYYGGLGTNLKAAKPVLGKAVLLSSLGSFITAGLVGLFAIFVLRMETLEGMLLGAVICSTDAASVFSILRSRKMDLRYNTASLLEVESGSNDPFSYLLTVVVLSLMQGERLSAGRIAQMLLLQIVVGIAVGAAISFVTVRLLRLLHLKDAVLTEAVMLGFGMLTYALTSLLSGNGYLAVYIAGILIGNQTIPDKTESIRFFHSLTGLMQMLLFFMLGLLAYPSKLTSVAGRPSCWQSFLLLPQGRLPPSFCCPRFGARRARSCSYPLPVCAAPPPLRSLSWQSAGPEICLTICSTRFSSSSCFPFWFRGH